MLVVSLRKCRRSIKQKHKRLLLFDVFLSHFPIFKSKKHESIRVEFHLGYSLQDVGHNRAAKFQPWTSSKQLQNSSSFRCNLVVCGYFRSPGFSCSPRKLSTFGFNKGVKHANRNCSFHKSCVECWKNSQIAESNVEKINDMENQGKPGSVKSAFQTHRRTCMSKL